MRHQSPSSPASSTATRSSVMSPAPALVRASTRPQQTRVRHILPRYLNSHSAAAKYRVSCHHVSPRSVTIQLSSGRGQQRNSSSPPLTCRQPGQPITDKLMSTVMMIMTIMVIMVMIMTREMFRSSHYNYLIIGHLHGPTICRLPLCLASECVSSDIKIVCLRPQTTDSQRVNLMKIFFLLMRKKW